MTANRPRQVTWELFCNPVKVKELHSPQGNSHREVLIERIQTCSNTNDKGNNLSCKFVYLASVQAFRANL